MLHAACTGLVIGLMPVGRLQRVHKRKATAISLTAPVATDELHSGRIAASAKTGLATALCLSGIGHTCKGTFSTICIGV